MSSASATRTIPASSVSGADVVEQARGRDHHLGVGGPHAVGGDHCRLDVLLAEQAVEPQRDVEHDPHVDPRVVRHPQPVGHRLRRVPPGLELKIAVGGGKKACKLGIPLSWRADAHARDGLRRWPFK